jgi:cellulose synthase/poly-beta-1,6-N-acetylglucosamine synthase-like glycosyltransferase
VDLVLSTAQDSEMLARSAAQLLARTEYRPADTVPQDALSIRAKSPAQLIGHAHLTAELNRAVRLGDGELIALLGAVEPVRSDWLDEMVSHALRREIGAVGALVYRSNGEIEHAGVVLGINRVAGFAFRGVSDPTRFPRALVLQNYSAVSGGCLVLRREAFEEVGGLDEINLPSAFADIDLCLRLAEHGYRVLWTPYAELRAPGTQPGGYAPVEDDQLRRQQEYMRSRWHAVIQHDPHYNPNLTLNRENFGLAIPPRIRKPWKNR